MLIKFKFYIKFKNSQKKQLVKTGTKKRKRKSEHSYKYKKLGE